MISAVGGHVQSEETYEQAAHRETKEEMGTDSEIIFFHKDYYVDLTEPKQTKHLVTYTSIQEGPFNPDSEEVEKVEFFSIAEISKMFKEGKDFHPDFRYILKKYYDIF